MIDSGRVGTIVGTAGEFKPLIVVGEYLYLQKMLHLENRFVDVLRRRLDAAIPAWSRGGCRGGPARRARSVRVPQRTVRSRWRTNSKRPYVRRCDTR